MKTNELIEKAEKLGVTVDIRYRDMDVYYEDLFIASLDMFEMFAVNTNYFNFCELDKDKQQQIFKLLIEYVSTPVKEREEEKKYMYRLKDKVKGITLKDSQYTFLSYKESDNKWYLSNGCNLLKTQFTHSWLKEHKVDIEQLQEFYDEIEVKE